MAINALSIAFITSEMQGLAKTGGLADVALSLPKALQAAGHAVSIILPYYKQMTASTELHGCYDMSLLIEGHHSHLSFCVFKLEHEGLPVYLIDYPHYFDRLSLYGEHNLGYPDNGERFAFFCCAAMHACKELQLKPDILHCNDWHTSLVPFLQHTRYMHDPYFKDTRSVLTIHNAAYQGSYPRNQLWMIPELTQHGTALFHQEHHDFNFLKCGLFYADKITAVSPNYAQELLTDLGAHGLGEFFRHRAPDLSGILNGCDYTSWDPQQDPLIASNYSPDDLNGKKICKQFLQKKMGLPCKDVPIYAMICRLTEQKGVHLLIPALEPFLRHRVQLIVMGTGDPDLTKQLHTLACSYPNKFVFLGHYGESETHEIKAGADFFLMPSIFEPCGLNQIYSLAYGTLPIVRSVGGLKNTVIHYDDAPEQGTGFVFQMPHTLDFLNTLHRSLIFYLQEPKAFNKMRKNAMRAQFLWSTSVAHYEHVYQTAFMETARTVPLD